MATTTTLALARIERGLPRRLLSWVAVVATLATAVLAIAGGRLLAGGSIGATATEGLAERLGGAASRSGLRACHLVDPIELHLLCVRSKHNRAFGGGQHRRPRSADRSLHVVWWCNSALELHNFANTAYSRSRAWS